MDSLNNIDSLSPEIKISYNEAVKKALEDNVVTDEEVTDMVTRFYLEKQETVDYIGKKSSKLRNTLLEGMEWETLEEKIIAINSKIKEIFKELDIKPNEKGMEAENAFKLFKYIIKNTEYDYAIMKEKENESIEEVEINDIYRALIEKRGVCSSYSSALILMFKQVGIESSCLIIADKGNTESNVHEIIKMTIGNVEMICEPTLIQNELKEGNIPDVNASVFAFKMEEYFEKFASNKEIKLELNGINLI